MVVKTAYQGNVLLEDVECNIKAHPITVHVPMDNSLTQDQVRERILGSVETHYQHRGRVVSLMLSEQRPAGKEIVALRRDPKSRNGSLQVNSVPKIDPGFRLGGEIITVSVEGVALH